MPSILRWLKFSYRSPSDSALFHTCPSHARLSTRMFTLLIQHGEFVVHLVAPVLVLFRFTRAAQRRKHKHEHNNKERFVFLHACTHCIFVSLPFVCMYLVPVLSFTFNRVFVRRNARNYGVT